MTNRVSCDKLKLTKKQVSKEIVKYMKNEEIRLSSNITTLKELKPGTAFVLAYPESIDKPNEIFVAIKKQDDCGGLKMFCVALKADDVVLIDSNESVIIVDAKTALEVAKK